MRKLENFPIAIEDPKSSNATKKQVAILLSRVTMVALFLVPDLLSYLDADAAAKESRATHLGGFLVGVFASATLVAASAAVRKTMPLSDTFLGEMKGVFKHNEGRII